MTWFPCDPSGRPPVGIWEGRTSGPWHSARIGRRGRQRGVAGFSVSRPIQRHNVALGGSLGGLGGVAEPAHPHSPQGGGHWCRA